MEKPMKRITRRGALKLLLKAAAVAVVGVAMPSVLMAKEPTRDQPGPKLAEPWF